MRIAHPFGLTLSMDSAREIARTAIHTPTVEGVSLVVTPNIDHIAMIRRLPALARAYGSAARIVCDGWPVQAYARWCGLPVERVTGCEITSELMRMVPYPSWQRLFFVVDCDRTMEAVRDWAARTGTVCDITIPPFGFERDTGYCARLAETIRRHGTTTLIMAVGAPRSEVFVDTHRALLPPCWAFCVGQAVKIELGLVKRASRRWQAVGLEWLWRLLQEPSRLARRYVTATIGFGRAVVEDQLSNRP
ncbi:MAG TPA: glycosyltransferase [Acetobacteraceae bacterium]|nr:glycosyltransferase [Acetobacteraceae bacterium]